MPVSSLRRIIHDPRILAGRWHVAGTTIPVGEVRLDHAARGTKQGYAYPGLSAEELADCLAFDFPPLREATVSLLTGTLVVACACGEDTAAAGQLNDAVDCVCGRSWDLRVYLIPRHERGAPVVPVAPPGDRDAVR